MIPDKLKDDFNSLRNMFDELKREIDKNVVREENYKGEFYEISPYSYQRNRFKQGKIVGNVTSLKTTNNLFTYYFDVKNQIIEIREGLELKNQFYYTFFIYEKELMKTIALDWSKTEKVLEVKDLCLPKAGGGYLVDHVNFDLHKGEILGIYGLMGAGRGEILECLMGMHPEHTGEVFLEGEKLDIKSISGQIDKGFALIPEDRQAQGLVQTMDIEKNCSLSAMKRYKKAGIFLDKTKEGQKVDEQIKDIHIKVADKHLPILSLSGGNQQKVVIGKGILTEPKILLILITFIFCFINNFHSFESFCIFFGFS